jgi:hypothetical protein
MDLKNRAAVPRPKSDGREKAMPNEAKAAAAASSLLPLDYMLSVMRDPTASAERRDRIAAMAAPYCHARYKSVNGMRLLVDQHRSMSASSSLMVRLPRSFRYPVAPRGMRTPAAIETPMVGLNS